MNETKQILDRITQALTPPPNATLSQSFQAYNNAIEILHNSLQEQYQKGYKNCEELMRKRKIDNQVKNN